MPKTLYLVRHAKSDWDNALADFNRPLNKRGFRDAPEMGRRFKARHALPDQIICSPAKRAFQTLEHLDLGVPHIRFEESIYEASTETLFRIIQSLENSIDSAMLIGHNPAMTWLASHLTHTVIANLPTCAIVALELPSNQWNEIGETPLKLLYLDYPKKTD
ncbi:histidine phosphatase family protein [Pontiellaceae bacterium B12219]|nr:histidine phosphatase family protein [Pontiellaceae bacterium B12219]